MIGRASRQLSQERFRSLKVGTANHTLLMRFRCTTKAYIILSIFSLLMMETARELIFSIQRSITRKEGTTSR